VFNGLLLPIILVFVMLVSRDRRLGPLRGGPVLEALGWLVTLLVSVMSVGFMVTLLLGFSG